MMMMRSRINVAHGEPDLSKIRIQIYDLDQLWGQLSQGRIKTLDKLTRASVESGPYSSV